MNDEIEAAIPDAKPTGKTRSTLLLVAMQAFLELDRVADKAEKAEQAKKEETLLAEFSELVVVPGVLAAE